MWQCLPESASLPGFPTRTDHIIKSLLYNRGIWDCRPTRRTSAQIVVVVSLVNRTFVVTIYACNLLFTAGTLYTCPSVC